MTQVFRVADLIKIDDADRPALNQFCWYVTPNGYVGAMTVRHGKRTLLLLHRVLLGEPKGCHVDHINGDTLDNRRANLRVASYTLNQANRHRLNRNNTSGIRGVAFVPHCGRWQARIMVNRKSLHLGRFSTREEAIATRRAAEIKFFGELCPTPMDRG